MSQCWLPEQRSCGFFISGKLPPVCEEYEDYEQVLTFSFPRNFSLGEKEARCNERQSIVNDLIAMIEDAVSIIKRRQIVTIELHLNQQIIEICAVHFDQHHPLIRQFAAIHIDDIEYFFSNHIDIDN